MPAHDTQTLVKGSKETFEVYTSQPLCLPSGSNTHFLSSALQSPRHARSSSASKDGRLKDQNSQITLQHVHFLSFSGNSVSNTQVHT